jgi:hypothetical protein
MAAMPEQADSASSMSTGRGCGTLLLVLLLHCGGILLAAWGLFRVSQGTGDLALFAAVTACGVLCVALVHWALKPFTKEHVRIGPLQLVAAAPSFTTAGLFIVAWSWPALLPEDMIKALVYCMMMEFITMHASIMLGAAGPGGPLKFPLANGFWMLVGIYMLFASIICLVARNIWLFIGFCVLIGNRIAGDKLCPPSQVEEQNRTHMVRWCGSAAFYMFFVFLTVFTPMPELAVTSSLDDGAWNEHPHMALAFGAMYFAAFGLQELYLTAKRVKPAAGNVDIGAGPC